MTSPETNPPDDQGPDPNPTSPADGIYDDNALRAEIARLIGDADSNGPLDDSERRARVEALRSRIQCGDYMSNEVIGEIVDRLLRRWKL